VTSPRVRLGAVSYLNTRPLIYGLEQSPRFDIRFDVPSRCAELLHAGGIDVGLIPSIEYLRGDAYRIVPGLSLASRGAVASVALYTSKPIGDVRSIALDTSSRTSVALVAILCTRLFRIAPRTVPHAPDLQPMPAGCDAALLIGDNALFLDHRAAGLTKIDLGEEWLRLTGLPFVYAFWAGRAGALSQSDVETLQRARDAGVRSPEEVARRMYPDDAFRQDVAVRYLRDNMRYDLGRDERAGLTLFYRYAAELGLVDRERELLFYEQ
jgi:chorismate dehydratase